jgi:hypothetical protein
MTRQSRIPVRAMHVLTCAALALVLAACTATGGRKSADEAVESTTARLEKRALERWKLLVAKQPDKAWEYLSPGVRATWPKEKYASEMSQRPVKWEKAELYKEAACEAEDACTIALLVTYSMDVPLPNVGRVTSPSVLEEKWIALDGVWYHVPAEFSRK